MKITNRALPKGQGAAHVSIKSYRDGGSPKSGIPAANAGRITIASPATASDVVSTGMGLGSFLAGEAIDRAGRLATQLFARDRIASNAKTALFLGALVAAYPFSVVLTVAAVSAIPASLALGAVTRAVIYR